MDYSGNNFTFAIQNMNILSMRIFFFLTIFIALCSCNNNLTTIGQGIIDNDGSVHAEIYNITEASTFKLDSFATSSGYSSEYPINELLIGSYEDRFSGKTSATPYFLVAPIASSNLRDNFVYDSLTFRFSSSGHVWGDTLNPQSQIYYLHQLKELPFLNPDKDNLFYNVDTAALGERIGVSRFLPLKESMERAYFKLNDDLGRKLFDMMLRRDAAFDDTWAFLRYFKGLAIVSDPGNNCLLGINANSDSLYLRFHFHSSEDENVLDFPVTHREYMFNNIKTVELPVYLDGIKNQRSQIPFQDSRRAITQGLNGYMIKMNLPNPPSTDKYTTIIKAVIELKPLLVMRSPIADAKSLNAYVLNYNNEIQGYMYNSPTLAVTGKYAFNQVDGEDVKYVFDVTGYYQSLSEKAPGSEQENYIAISVPYYTTSFDRMILEEIPILKIYYATYN